MPVRRPPVIRLLAADPDLAAGLAPDDAGPAREAAVAAVLALAPGPWPRTHGPQTRGGLGLLLLDGVLQRQVTVTGRAGAELLGAGDVVCPDSEDDEGSSLPAEVRWTVLEATRVAVLDRRFSLAIARWPEVSAAIMERAARRAHRQSLNQAIGDAPTVERRVLGLFWTLADRWGTVEPDGVHLTLKLTHGQLAGLVGAQRPSVTAALSRLSARRVVVRRADRSWLLRAAPPCLDGDGDGDRHASAGLVGGALLPAVTTAAGWLAGGPPLHHGGSVLPQLAVAALPALGRGLRACQPTDRGG